MKLSSISLGTVPRGSRAKPDFMGIYSVDRIDVRAVVPPHDSVRFHWDAEKLDSLLGFKQFSPERLVRVEVVTSMNRTFSATEPIQENIRGAA